MGNEAETYILQDCLDEWMALFSHSCGSGILTASIMRLSCVRQSCWVNKKAPHWMQASPAGENKK
jgi:hypothetical protein